jgi:hypothetical protein
MLGKCFDVKRIAPTHRVRCHENDLGPILFQASGNDGEIAPELGAGEPWLGPSLIHVDPRVIDTELHDHEVRVMTANVAIQAGHGLPGGGIPDTGVSDDRADVLPRKCRGQAIRIDLLDLGGPISSGGGRGITEGHDADRMTRCGQSSNAPELSGAMREGA